MYCPDTNITLAEMAVFIERAFGIPLLQSKQKQDH
jgi:hypothetical protein